MWSTTHNRRNRKMNVKISFDNTAMERRGHTLEAVHLTIKACLPPTIFPVFLTKISSSSRTKATAMTSPSCGTSSCLCCGPTGSWTAPPPAFGRTKQGRKIYSPRPERYETPYGNNFPRDTPPFPQNFNHATAQKRPRFGGANALAARGCESASIAKMYIFTLAGSIP